MEVVTLFYRGWTLEDLILSEKEGRRYSCSCEDRITLNCMFKEINIRLGTDIHYLAELDYYYYYGIGDILIKYIDLFVSEEVRAYLLPQLVVNKVENCANEIVRLYNHFKTSNVYSSNDEDVTIPIYYRYDDSFKHLRSRKIKRQLLEFAYNPRDVFYLRDTIKMLSSWKIDEMEMLLRQYLESDRYKPEDFLIYDTSDWNSMNQFRVMKIYLREVGIYGLRYYPSKDNIELLKSFLNDEYQYIRELTKKSIDKIDNTLVRMNTN